MPHTEFHAETASTAGMPPGDAREFWRSVATNYQCQMDCEFPENEAVTGTLTRMRTDRNQVLAWHSPPVRYGRKPKHVRKDGIDSYVLLAPTAGTAIIDADDGELVLRPGYASLVSTARPFTVTHSPHAQLRAVTIQRREIQRRMNRHARLSAPLDFSTGLGGVVHNLLDSIVRELDQLTSHQFDAVVDRLTELLCIQLGDCVINAGDHYSEIEAAIRRYVRDHAQDPGLNGEMIASALGWSVRQIQLALQRAGTTARELVREERLSLAHDCLANPAYRNISITELAHRCGFVSAGTFSTAFRQRFGMTPRELRVASF
ncbi:AraC-type DNA-binding protein [Amycolatopsis marina]|uniref:AraC-type DNA-binding protein n=1 Tax=Amycolatopsis marina TaxID=490629 RepID=A0A1I1BN87_9PSEU|nr:helix-turn-helix domain-containing protein [Amycolatopsis marina]SFB49813.1 AraC-type DNA-binding protein [Amycolatopsis marina]